MALDLKNLIKFKYVRQIYNGSFWQCGKIFGDAQTLAITSEFALSRIRRNCDYTFLVLVI